jgi:nitrate/nitrite transporter NarK
MTHYSPYRWLILIVGCLALTFYAINLILYVPLFSILTKDLNVGMDACLNLSMAMVVVVAFVAGFGGILVDRFSLTTIYVCSTLCAAVPSVLMPWIGHHYTMVFLSRLVQGFAAISFATIGPILAHWFPPREQGIAGGLLQGAIPFGTAITLIFMPDILDFAGSWQRAVALSSIPGWITILLSILVIRTPPSTQYDKAVTKTVEKIVPNKVTYFEIMTWPVTWLGMFLFFFNACGFYTLYNVVPPYLSMAPPMGLGLVPDTAELLSLFLVIIGIPSFILGGFFFDKIAKGEAKPAIFIAFILAGTSAFLLIQPSINHNITYLSIVLMAAGFGPTFPGASLTGFIAKTYPSHLVGSMIGFWFGIGTLGGALGIYLTGKATAMVGSFDWGFRIIALACVVGFFLSFMLKSPKPSEIQS